MRHLPTSKYVQKAASNEAPYYRSVLEWVSLNIHSISIDTIIVKFVLEVYSCEGLVVFHFWDDLGVVQIKETMGYFLKQLLIFDHLNNNNYKGNLFQLIEIGINNIIYL